MNITLNDRTLQPLRNFWSALHFHPTDAIEDDWGQKILDRMARDRIAHTVRMYVMLEDIVTRDAGGALCYDFALTDIRLDYLTSHGFKPLLCYAFVPPCMASNSREQSSMSHAKTRYKGKMIITSPPDNYDEFAEICCQYTRHIVERYGIEEVRTWYLECYNEPDFIGFFMQNEYQANEEWYDCAYSDERLEELLREEKPLAEVRTYEYCKLYRAFAQGVTRVDPGLRVGGPGLAFDMSFLMHLIRFVKKEQLPFRFVSFHTYGTDVARFGRGEEDLSASNSVQKIEFVKKLVDRLGGGIPLVVDEWGAASGGFVNMEQYPRAVFRENEVFAAYFVKMLTLYESMALPIEKLMICLSGQHEMKTEFTGFRGMFTLSFLPKPIYHAYVLAAKIKKQKLSFTSDENKNFTVLPSRDETGTVVLLSYSSENFETPLPPQEVTLRFDLPHGKTARLYCIDRNHANGYRAFEGMGAPRTITPAQMEILRREAELKEETLAFTGDALTFTMTDNSVVLIEAE